MAGHKMTSGTRSTAVASPTHRRSTHLAGLQQVPRIIHAHDAEALAVCQVLKGRTAASRLRQQPLSSLLRRRASAQLVEDVIVALRVVDAHHARALQQVCAHGGARDLAGGAEVDFNVLRKQAFERWVRTKV